MDTPTDLSKISDADLLASIDVGLRQLEAGDGANNASGSPAPANTDTPASGLSGGASEQPEARAPGFRFEDVLRGLTKAEVERAGSDVEFAQFAFDRHTRFDRDFVTGRAAFVQDEPTEDDLRFARWLRDTGRLDSADSPGFWKTLGDVVASTAAGLPEVFGEAFRYRKAKLFGSSQDKKEAEERSEAFGAELVNQVRGLYSSLAVGARRLGERVVIATLGQLAAWQRDPAFVARTENANEFSWYRHQARLTAIAAEQEQVHGEAASIAVRAGWSASGLENAAMFGGFVADPAQLVVGAGTAAVSKAVSRAAGRATSNAALGIADGMRAELKAGAARIATMEQTVAGLTAQGGAEAATLSEIFARDLAKAQATHAERAASLAKLDAENLAALRDLGRPPLPARVVAQSVTSAAGVVESAGSWLARKNVGVVDRVLSQLDAPAKGATSAVARAAEKVAPTSAAGAVIGAATSDDWKSGAVAGAAAGAALPSTLSNAGRLSRILGENYLTGRAATSYLARLATDAEATGLERFAFRQLDTFTPAVDFARNLGGAVGKSAATGAAFGVVASGGETSDLASAAGAGAAGHVMPWALISNLRGIWRPVRSPGEFERMRAANLRVLRERWAGSENLARLDSLPPSTQLDVAHILHANPDVLVRLVGKDDAVIAADQLARGKTPTDLTKIPGLHYKDPVSGRSALVLNLEHPDAMAPVLAHEFWHAAQSGGLAQSIVAELIGAPELGLPGFFTKIDPETGAPVRRADGTFELTPDFASAKSEYERRAAHAGFSEPLTDAEFALEHAAEQGADFILSPKFDEALRPTIGAMIADLFPQALRDAIGAADGALTSDGKVRGSLGLGLNHAPAVEKLQAAYLKRWRVGRNETGDSDALSGVEIARHKILASPEVLRALAHTSEVNVDAKTGEIAGTKVDSVSGKLVVTDPAKVFKAAAQIASEQAELSRFILEAVKSAPDVATDKDAVRVVVVDGKEVATGRYLSEATVEALEKSGKFSPFQIQNIRNLNTLTKSGTGGYVRFMYFPTTRGRSKTSRSLRAHWREEIPYGWQISAADNVLFRTVSTDKVVANLEKLWAKDNERASALWSSHVSMIADATRYLRNLSAGRPGDTGLDASRRDFLNVALGINTSGRPDVNPLFDPAAHGRLTSFITSRRIDRTSRLTAPESKERLPWSYDAYVRGRENLTPGKPETPESGLPGDEKPAQSARDGRGNQSEAPGEVSRHDADRAVTDTGRGIEFREAIAAARASHPAGAAVDVKSAETYGDSASKLFLSEDKTAGAAVLADGDLVSVFKAKGSPVRIDDILAEAAPHAKKLDAFASGNGYLPNLYGRHGFRPVARVAFDAEQAPAGIAEKFGAPDVVFMVRDPEGVTGAPEIRGDYISQQDKVPLVSYPEALEIQEKAVAAVEAAKK